MTRGNNIGLVKVAWVCERLEDPRLRVIDVRALMEEFQIGYPFGHIPGAVPLDLGELFLPINEVPGRLVQQFEGEGVLGRLGLNREHVALIYDEGSGPLAAQMAWLLAYYGHPEIRVLDGGWQSWELEEASISAEAAQPKHTTYIAELDPPQLATANWIAARLGDPDVTLLDARTAREYEIGRLPGAINIPYEENLTNEDIPFLKPATELRAGFEKIGIGPGKEIVVYCETGARSAHTYLTLRSLGYERVRNYEGSWAEWSRRMDLPVDGEREAPSAATCSPVAPCGSGAEATLSTN